MKNKLFFLNEEFGTRRCIAEILFFILRIELRFVLTCLLSNIFLFVFQIFLAFRNEFYCTFYKTILASTYSKELNITKKCYKHLLRKYLHADESDTIAKVKNTKVEFIFVIDLCYEFKKFSLDMS